MHFHKPFQKSLQLSVKSSIREINSRSEIPKKEKIENEEILEVKAHFPEHEHQDQPKRDAAAEGREQVAEPHASPPAHQGYSDRVPEDDDRTAPQDQLLKLHAVLEQELHGVQQLTLETARQ